MRLEELFSKVLNIPLSQVTDELSQTSSQSWDSVSHINIIAALEETYNVTFKTGEIRALKSFPDARRLLREKGVAL